MLNSGGTNASTGRSSSRISFLVMIFGRGRCRKSSSVAILLALSLLHLCCSTTTGQEQTFLLTPSSPAVSKETEPHFDTDRDKQFTPEESEPLSLEMDSTTGGSIENIDNQPQETSTDAEFQNEELEPTTTTNDTSTDQPQELNSSFSESLSSQSAGVDDSVMQLPNSVNNTDITETLSYEASKVTDKNLETPEKLVRASTEAVEAVIATDEMKPQETASDSQKEEAYDDDDDDDYDDGDESDDSSKRENGITGTGDSIPAQDIQDEYTPTPNEYQDSNSRVMPTLPNDNEAVPVEAGAIQGQEVSGTDSERAEPEANTTPHPAYSPEAESSILETESSPSAPSNAATVDVDKDTGEATSQEIHDHDLHHRDQDNNKNELPINSVDNRAQNATTEYSTASSTSETEISEPEATHSNTISDTVEPSVAEQEQEPAEDSSSKNNSFVIVVKYLSSTLLTFLPEHLQDTILDVNDALVFTGIIVLLIIGLCVPYFFVETFLSSRPLKKKVVDLNKALWKVSAAYECQQDEFEAFKKKAFEYDECLSKIEKLETQLELKKSIDQKQKLEIQHLRNEGKKRAKLEAEVNALVQTTMTDLAKVKEERNKYASAAASLKKTLKETTEDLELIQAELNSKTMDLELLVSSKDFTENRVKVSENEIAELKSKLSSEITLRRETQDQVNGLNKARETLQEDLTNLRKITLQYEETVNNLTTEISLKENELYALKDSLGDDSPLVEIAEIKAKLSIAEAETKSLQSKIDSTTLENKTLTREYEESSETLVSVTAEKDEAQKRLQVLEAYFKEKEEELRKIVERQQVEQEIRGKDKNELINLIQEKTAEISNLNERIEQLKLEFEETKNQHRNEIRAKDQKNHQQWLALCQSERKVKDVKEEADSYRLKLTQLANERGDENDTLMDGEEFFPVIPPPPLDEVPVSYFGLGFEPPAPLDDDELNGETIHSSSGGFEPNRPNPVGSISGSESDDVTEISPIVDHDAGRGGRGDFSDGSTPPTGRPVSREDWMNGNSGRVNYNNNNNSKKNPNNNRTDQRLRHPNQGPQSASSPINEHSSLSSLC